MSLISRLLHAIQPKRHRPGGRKITKRAAVSMEHLEHRQLLAVNFTGNVKVDFPATQQPGVVVIPATTPSAIAEVPPIFSTPANDPAIPVSGFTLSGIRLSYSASDDVLSIGIDQPTASSGSQYSVIAGDADANGNDGTLSQRVQDIVDNNGLNFIDSPDFGSTEYMGVSLDLNQDGYADIVAGYSEDDPRSPKLYQVAKAVVNPNSPPSIPPSFGTPLPNNTGNVYKVNSPLHPNLEFDIKNFSQLYLDTTGQSLTPDKILSFGAFAGSGDDDGIREAIMPFVPVPWGNTIVPPPVCPPPPECPPISPPVVINPHQNNHINTAHPTDIRISILGTSGFDVQQIDPSTVQFGGATPVFSFFRRVNNDPFLDVTYVFRGTDVVLPPGVIMAPITGALYSGQKFETSARVFNRDSSFYSPADVAQAQQRQFAAPGRLQTPISVLQAKLDRSSAIGAAGVPRGPAAFQARQVRRTPARPPVARQVSSQSAPMVVSIPRRQPVVAGARQSGGISARLKSSLDSYMDHSMYMTDYSIAESSR